MFKARRFYLRAAVLWLALAPALPELRAEQLILPVTRQVQSNDWWCWAASMAMVFNHLDESRVYLQCELAAKQLELSHPCCGEPLSKDCLKGVELQKADFLRFGFTAEKERKSSWTVITNEIAAGRPVIDWEIYEEKGTSISHMRVIAGYALDAAGGPRLFIKDPSPPPEHGKYIYPGGTSYFINYGTYFERNNQTYHHIQKKAP